MATNHTEHYQLSQWEATDKVLRTEFNADNAKIDAAIRAVQQKADSLAVSKADVSALEANALSLEAEAQARTAAVSALNTAVGKLGNCRVEYFLFTDSASASQTSRITFSGTPEFFITMGSAIILGSRNLNSVTELFISSGALSLRGYSVTWNGRTCILSRGLSGTFNVFAFYRQDL